MEWNEKQDKGTGLGEEDKPAKDPRESSQSNRAWPQEGTGINSPGLCTNSSLSEIHPLPTSPCLLFQSTAHVQCPPGSTPIPSSPEPDKVLRLPRAPRAGARWWREQTFGSGQAALQKPRSSQLANGITTLQGFYFS